MSEPQDVAVDWWFGAGPLWDEPPVDWDQVAADLEADEAFVEWLGTYEPFVDWCEFVDHEEEAEHERQVAELVREQHPRMFELAEAS